MLASQIAGALLGWWLWGVMSASSPGMAAQAVAALTGALCAGWIWWLVDSWNAMRLLSWLRQSELREAPELSGIWGEASVRMRRWLRQSVQQVQQGDQRLNDILSALQASPNGVVLLDADGRIEWCNQIAARQFGFDAERDLLQSIGNLVRDPEFSAYFATQDFSLDLVMQGRESTASRPVKLSVQLYGYGEGRKLLLARDVAAVGINATAVTPGCFADERGREELRSGRRARRRIADYHAQGTRAATASSASLGDPERAAQAVLLVASTRRPPRRLLLGSAALDNVRRKIGDLQEELSDWELVSMNTDLSAGRA